MFRAVNSPAGWRIHIGDRNLCGAINEQVARETAAALNSYRMSHP
ncbi:hypothetical protein [Mesorhizobium sp. M8A.F.Ca.ET.021.01.1.1]|nr:hypothetical protein [Mesorhizobium sp. M8A.F.Ca.ET.021.01.1.1]